MKIEFSNFEPESLETEDLNITVQKILFDLEDDRQKMFH